MIRNHFIRKIVFIISMLSVLLVAAGCGEHNYKKEADEQVYNIIDQKWREDYGTKANYKISDTEPLENDIQIERAVPASGIISLSDAVALATAHNREYHTQKEALYLKALDLRLTRHEFERQYFGIITSGYDVDRYNEVVGREANYGFNQLLASGAKISTRLALIGVNVLSGNLRSGLAALLDVTVTQPLLRGSDRKIVLENLTQAERDTLYEVRSFNRFRKAFVVSTITQYYEVLFLFEVMHNARKNYDTLNAIYGRVEKLANAGRLPLAELDRVSQEKLKAWDTYIQAEKIYKEALDEFKITLSLPTTAQFQLDYAELEALKNAKMAKPDFDEDEVIEAALYQRLDLTNNADAVIDAQRKVFVAADSLRAELNLVGNSRTISSGRADRSTLTPLGKNYNLGFELDLPLDRVPEQHVYRKALINLNQQLREYDLAADMVRLEVRKAYRDLVEASERYQTQSEGFKLAEERFRKTFLLMQYGRVSSRRVLSAQEDLFNAQNAATEALIDYTISTLNYYRDTEILHVRPDGMWER